jgi:ATP-binding cassette, subfamily B, bacterial CvaB/MchF/RaxB
LFAFTSYQGQFTSRIGSLIDYCVQLRMLSLHTERLGDIVLSEPENEDPALQLQDWSHLQPSIELRNVSFRYGEGERWVLRNVNLKVEPGESLAIVGASGGGKTTLLKVMLGLLQPIEGEVLIGGVPLQQMGLKAARNLVGTVMQDDVLLSGNLQDNICFFDLQADPARAQAAAQQAQVHAEIVAMPMGYQTLVGDLGSGLSGGQKQRILLARALYKQPKILALDEATSHLDVPNERAVTQALAQLPLTRVVIAHRPETIAGAKRVVQLTPHGREGAQVQEVMRAVA